MRTLVFTVALVIVAVRADAATWTFDSQTDYPIFAGDQSGLRKTQGIAWNPQTGEWITSWQYGLERNDAAFQPLQQTGSVDPVTLAVSTGIPQALADQGFDHIGDIDVWNGVIYASLDSEAGDYQNGHVALFNAADLSYSGTLLPLIGDPTNLRNDVASWVAVDGPAELGYGKEWKSGDTINVYNLADWSFRETLKLDRSLRAIQGAKVLDGVMYLSAHDATKSVYSVDLATGSVEELFQMAVVADAFNETEGIAVRRLKDGSLEMYFEMIVVPGATGEAGAFLRMSRFVSPAVAPVAIPATLPLALSAFGIAFSLTRVRRV